MKDFREAHPTSDSLDDNGCRALAAAVVLQAASDMYADLSFDRKRTFRPGSLARHDNSDWSVKVIREFIFSKWFNCLTDLDPKRFYDTVIFWWRNKKDLPGYISLWRKRLEEAEPEPESDYYDSSMLKNILNNYSYRANWEPKGGCKAYFEKREEVQ